MRYYKQWIWRLRIRLASVLIGDRSFVANVDVIGSVIMYKTTWGVSMVNNVWIFDPKLTEEEREEVKGKARYADQ